MNSVNKEPLIQDVLIEESLKARKNAYCPYSNFAVGAALLGKSGKIYTGCNVENGAYSATICAERNALCKAISEGEREFVKIAVVGAMCGEEPKEMCFPCGICRQSLYEFCATDFEVILFDGKNIEKYRLGELLFEGFKLNK